MSRMFNTSADRITGEQMLAYAARLLAKPTCDVSAREAMAALPALRARNNGASALRCKELFDQAMKEIIE